MRRASVLSHIQSAAVAAVVAALTLSSFLAQPAAAGWEVQVVDSNGDVGRWTSIALDSAGNPSISYVDFIAGGNASFGAKVKYARWTGAAWLLETVPDPGESGQKNRAGERGTSLALDADGNPHIAYCLSSGDNCGGLSVLRYARWTGSAWTFDTADNFKNGVGHYPSLALDSQDRARIAHRQWFSFQNTGLRYVEWTGSKWNKQVVDGPYAVYPSLVLDANEQPQISYRTSYGPGELRLATKDRKSWTLETIDEVQAGVTSLQVEANGRQHIAYASGEPARLHYARWTASGWDIQVVDDTGGLCGDTGGPSLALDSSGYAHIVYTTRADCSSAAGRSLKYARWTGSAWAIEVVEESSNGSTGLYPSLVVDGAGAPHIGYYDATNGVLKYATWVSQP